MRTFNLVKSLSTRVNNITSLPFRKGLGLGRLILCLSLATFGVENAWGGKNSKYTATVAASPTGVGSVYVNGKPSESRKPTKDSEKNVSWPLKAEPNTNYIFKEWQQDNEEGTIKN